MREIKDLGQVRHKDRNYRHALFECPICGKIVEKIKKDGIRIKSCSYKCSQKFKEERVNYRPYVIISGYKYLYKPNHPKTLKNELYIAEHRYIFEQNIGRYLKDDEVVHHLNGNKLDNRFSNLILLSSSDHSKLHAYYSQINKRGGIDNVAI
ncbi:MAG: HNH endonuclease [Christensenellaceae bacterium]|jgi:ribosomal protein L37AE/L43A|nr:HNH endonuclease [Christensenellaceae bacterium]